MLGAPTFYENNILQYELHHISHDKNSNPIASSPTKEGLLKHCIAFRLNPSRHYINIIGFKVKMGMKVPFTINDHPIWLTRFLKVEKAPPLTKNISANGF